jgi:hypothetical protein
MNFQELLARMKQIDEANGDPDMASAENPEMSADDMEECGDSPMGKTPTDQLLIGEKDMGECGMPGMMNMPSGMMGTSAPKQPDSVTMNLSMNGSGAGGIRDLMDILRNLENSGEHSHDMAGGSDAMIIGVGEEQSDGGFQSASTEPDTTISDISAMTHNGGDLNREKQQYAKAQDGDNAMAVSESLVNHLANLYQEVKLR